MKLPLIRQSSVSRSRDMRFKRAVRLSGEFFIKGSGKSWCGICGAFVARLAQLGESDVTFNKQLLSQYLNN